MIGILSSILRPSSSMLKTRKTLSRARIARVSKVLLSFVFSAAITFGAIYPASALPRTINQTSETQNIATGVTLERVRRFTDNGWLNFNVIRADMNNPYVYADTITDSSSIQNLISPLTEARNRNAVAAVNGSFFIWTDVNNKIIPIGPIVDSGGIKTSYMELNNAQSKMATLSINVLNEILCDFWKTEMWLENKNGVSLVSRYNRPYYGYTDLSVIDRKWSSTSAGSTVSGTIEMVVVNNIVTEIRKGLPPITIPENGFVVVSKNQGANLLQQKFNIGDKVSFKTITAPVSWENTKMAISGGSLLVNNGKIPPSFSHDSPGANPRTAVGASRDSKELIVVTVDGRQDASFGLTQYELAELMLELGAYNAINMDGGGSTAMVARLPGDLSANVVNVPSDGAVRKVANALGIFSSAPKGPITRLIIDCEDRNIFAGTSRKFTVKAVDAFLNPMPIDESQVVWGVYGSGGSSSGSFKGSTFYPAAAGKGSITATYGGVTTHYEVNVLESPVRLIPNRSSIEILIGESRTLSFIGSDTKGTKAPINISDISFLTEGQPVAPGIITNGTFKATALSSGYIKASVGNTHTYIKVDIPQHWTLPLDDFEYHNGSFWGYPASVKGSYALSPDQKVSGRLSGRLIYDFLNEAEKTRGAYLIFTNPIPLEPTAIKLELDVYNTTPNSSRVRAEIIDTEGIIRRVEFSSNLNWKGWKHLSTDIEGFTPAKLTRLYVVQTESVQTSGTLYFENLTAEIPIYAQGPEIPESSAPADTEMRVVSYKPDPQSSSEVLRFSVFSQLKAARNPLERVIETKMSEKINKFDSNYIDVSILLGNGTNEISKLVNIAQLATCTAVSPKSGQNGPADVSGSSSNSSSSGSISVLLPGSNNQYAALDIKSSRLISLDTSAGGLRSSSKEQWQWLNKQLLNNEKKNIFIFMNKNPDEFTDSEEGQLFKKVIADCSANTSAKIWVFYTGKTGNQIYNNSEMDFGVKYISFSSLGASGMVPENLDEAQYILVTVQGGEVTYEIKPVV